MTFAELLQKRKDAVVRRWLDAALATYGADASAAFRRQKDPFANPVGASLRAATREVFQALLDGADDEAIRRALNEAVKIRAVQQFSPSAAVGFVFRLKEAVREELAAAAEDPAYAAEWIEFQRQIDQVALAAFEIFVECREQVSELRINEVKRQVSWILGKMNERGFDPEPSPVEGTGD